MQPSVPPSPSDTPVVPRVGSALDDVNDAFHEAYDRARESAERKGPVLVVLADLLVLVNGETRRELPFAPPLFHVVKSVAHAPVALFALLHRVTDRPLAEDLLEVLRARGRALDASLAVVPEDVESAADGHEPRSTAHIARDLRAVLGACRRFVDRALEERVVFAAALATFARDTGAQLLRLTADATEVQLDGLHGRVEEAVQGLSAEDLAALHVVVTGNHQARVRSLAMQYFQRRFRDADDREARVTYGEGIETEEDALALVGTQRLDRAIARAFFGDARRLQRDVLGDAAAARLAKMTLRPLG